MREAERGLRSQLRVLQIAKMEGWEVARHYVEVLERATEDPFLIEARRRVANQTTESENDTESKSEIDYSEKYY